MTWSSGVCFLTASGNGGGIFYSPFSNQKELQRNEITRGLEEVLSAACRSRDEHVRDLYTWKRNSGREESFIIFQPIRRDLQLMRAHQNRTAQAS